MRLLTVLTALCALLFTSCADEPPESCTRVYVHMPESEANLLEFERYFPRQRAYGYYKSFYSFRRDSIEYRLEFNKHNFMDRSRDFTKGRGMLSIDQYLKYCVDNRTPGDTMFVMQDIEGGNYREYRVFDRYELVHTDESLVQRELDGDRTNLMHYNYGEGDFSPLDAKRHRVSVKEISEIYCMEMYDVMRWEKLKGYQETYIKEFGCVYQNDDDVEWRLGTVNGAPYLSHIRDLCN